MIEYQYTDGGRSEVFSGKGNAGDCVTRALSIISGRPYKECYDRLAEANKKYNGGRKSARNGVDKRAYAKVYKEFGLKKISLFNMKPRPTFTEAYNQFGDCIVSTTKHVAAIVDGVLLDNHNCLEYEWFGEIRERKAMTVYVMEK